MKNTINLSLIALLILVIILGRYLYYQEWNNKLEEKLNDFSSINQLRISQIAEWYNDEVNDAIFLSQNSTLNSTIKDYIAHNSSVTKSSLRNYLENLKSEHGYSTLTLSNYEGSILLSTSEEDTVINPFTVQKIKESIDIDSISSTGLYRLPNRQPLLDFIVPLKVEQHDLFLVLRISLDDYLFPLLEYTPSYNSTFQRYILLAEQDKFRILSNINNDPDTLINNDNYYLKNSLIRFTNQDSLKNRGEGIDYNNEKVLAFFDPIPGTPWTLLSKINHSEAFKDFNKEALLIALTSILVIFLIILTLSYIYSRRQSDIYKSLWQSQEEFKTTLYSIGDAVIITDDHGIIRNLNHKAEELTGWQESESYGKKLDDIIKFVNDIRKVKIESPVDTVLDKGTIIEIDNNTTITSRDGNHLSISGSASPIKDKRKIIIGVVLIIRDQTIERRNQAKLIESEANYRRMFYDNPQPMLIYDPNTLEFIEINEAAINHYGYSREEFLKMTLKDIRPPEEVSTLLVYMSSGRHSSLNPGIWKHLKKNGEIIYVKVTSHDVTFNNMKARHVLVNDISNLKETQIALADSEQKFRNLFENHSAVKLIIEAETGKIAYANEAAALFYGWTIDELCEMNMNQINTVHPLEHKKLIQDVKAKKKMHFEFKHRKSDGSICDVEVFSSLIDMSDKQYLHSIVQDVTEKKKAEQKINVLIKSIEQSPVGILITNSSGSIEYCNPKFTEITEYTNEEIIGKTPNVLESNKQSKELLLTIWELLLNGKAWKGEFNDKKKYGESYWSNIAISPVIDEEDQLKHLVLVYEDITEQKQILSELVKAKEKAIESDHLKTAFLANMSHEIRTPMNGILGFMDLLQEPDLSGDQYDEYLKIVKVSGNRLLDTINDIIDISKIESGQSHLFNMETDVNQILEDQFNFFKPEANDKGLKFSIADYLEEDENSIIIDKMKLSSVLTNLIKNSLKFTKTGYLEFGCQLNDDILYFYVKDTGKGIPENRIPYIFDRFVQADIGFSKEYEGSGLGLSISKAYVEMMGGKISVESEVGKGSIFSFSIPYNPSKKAPSHNSFDYKLGNVASGERKILIAEDDDISYLYTSTILNAHKHELTRAFNGEEALELCRNNDYSAILMDIKMPVMDGYEATRLIREFNTTVPIIALTAFAFSDDREKAISNGCTDYLSKPVRKEVLINIIDKYGKKEAI